MIEISVDYFCIYLFGGVVMVVWWLYEGLWCILIKSYFWYCEEVVCEVDDEFYLVFYF